MSLRYIEHMTQFFHLTSHRRSQCDVPPHNFNFRSLLSIQPQETMAKNIGLTAAKELEACSLLKDVPQRNF